VDLYLHSPNTPSWRGAQLKHKAPSHEDVLGFGGGGIAPRILNQGTRLR
jgi:hypothetical protein